MWQLQEWLASEVVIVIIIFGCTCGLLVIRLAIPTESVGVDLHPNNSQELGKDY